MLACFFTLSLASDPRKRTTETPSTTAMTSQKQLTRRSRPRRHHSNRLAIRERDWKSTNRRLEALEDFDDSLTLVSNASEGEFYQWSPWTERSRNARRRGGTTKGRRLGREQTRARCVVLSSNVVHPFVCVSLRGTGGSTQPLVLLFSFRMQHYCVDSGTGRQGTARLVCRWCEIAEKRCCRRRKTGRTTSGRWRPAC